MEDIKYKKEMERVILVAVHEKGMGEDASSLEELAEAMKLGELGEQVVLKSEKAFDMLTFEEATPVDSSIYHPKWVSRDQKAREDYRKMKERSNPLEGTFIIDIIRQQWRNDDERLR